MTIDEPRWISKFRIHRRMVDRLRVGRCLIAGDAAHIHSPVGGQGMNIGIRDACSLAEKLAGVIHESGDEALLDSFEKERLPVARGVLRGTDLATRLVLIKSPVLQWIRNRSIKAALGSAFFRRRLTRRIAGY